MTRTAGLDLHCRPMPGRPGRRQSGHVSVTTVQSAQPGRAGRAQLGGQGWAGGTASAHARLLLSVPGMGPPALARRGPGGAAPRRCRAGLGRRQWLDGPALGPRLCCQGPVARLR